MNPARLRRHARGLVPLVSTFGCFPVAILPPWSIPIYSPLSSTSVPWHGSSHRQAAGHLLTDARQASQPWLRLHRRRQMNTTPQVALVTGASSGFGQATAARLSAQGFQVFGTSRAPLHKEASSVELLPLDVNSETSVQMCVQTILGRTGRIDLLVNNAGFARAGGLEENSLEEAHAQFDTNVFGVLRLLKAVLPVMRKQGGGQIITVSSLLGVVAMPYLGLYASSKFALEGMIEGLSHELRRAAS